MEHVETEWPKMEHKCILTEYNSIVINFITTVTTVRPIIVRPTC